MVVELSLKKRNMRLVNPLNVPITIMYKGVEFTAPANGVTKDLSNDTAKYWLDIHQFLTIEGVKENEEVIDKKK